MVLHVGGMVNKVKVWNEKEKASSFAQQPVVVKGDGILRLVNTVKDVIGNIPKIALTIDSNAGDLQSFYKLVEALELKMCQAYSA